jgi:hypothetical protein
MKNFPGTNSVILSDASIREMITAGIIDLLGHSVRITDVTKTETYRSDVGFTVEFTTDPEPQPYVDVADNVAVPQQPAEAEADDLLHL